jgi:hypothetical protein
LPPTSISSLPMLLVAPSNRRTSPIACKLGNYQISTTSKRCAALVSGKGRTRVPSATLRLRSCLDKVRALYRSQHFAFAYPLSVLTRGPP